MRAKWRARSAVPRQESLAHAPTALRCTIDSSESNPCQGADSVRTPWQDATCLYFPGSGSFHNSIAAKVLGGVVTLTGDVRDVLHKCGAEEAVKRIGGSDFARTSSRLGRAQPG